MEYMISKEADDEIFSPAEAVPLEWADLARGAILEIGLGRGILAREIGKRGPHGCHHIVESRKDVIEWNRGSLPEKCSVIHASFPCDVPRGRYNVILIDVMNITDDMILAAFDLLADGGVLAVRK